MVRAFLATAAGILLLAASPNAAIAGAEMIAGENAVGPGVDADLAAYGAKGDCATDDTAAVSRAIAAAKAVSTASGTLPIVVLNRPCYALNLTITGTNLILRHGGMASNHFPASRLVPFDPTRPVIQVGDGSTPTAGLQFDNISLQGGGKGQVGLYIDGAQSLYFNNFAAWGFTDASVSITDTAAQPATLIWFDDFEIAPANVLGSVGLKAVNPSGGSYLTAVYLNNGHFESGGTKSGELLHLENLGHDELLVSANNAYFDCEYAAPGVAGCLATSGTANTVLYANDVAFDAGGKLAIDLSSGTAHWLTDAVQGNFTISGTFKTPDENYTSSPKWPLGYWLPQQSVLTRPIIVGCLNITDDRHNFVTSVTEANRNQICRTGPFYEVAGGWRPAGNDAHDLGGAAEAWLNVYAEHVGGSAQVSVAPGGPIQIGVGGSVACSASHKCDDFSGELTVSTGIGTLGAGPIAKVEFAKRRSRAPNCVVEVFGGKSYLAPSKTASPSSLIISVGSALSDRLIYTADYVCGGD